MHKNTFHTSPGGFMFFQQWALNGKKEIYLTCLILVVLGVAYQGIKFARQQYGRRCHNIKCKRYILNQGHLLQTLMYLLQFISGYALMLAVMTFNIWIFAAVLVGFGLGYLFFGWGEYESPKVAFRVTMMPKSCSYFHSCGGVSASSSANQELLSFNKSEDDVSSFRDSPSNIRCTCNNTRI